MKSDPATTVSLWNERLKSYSSCNGDEVNLEELSGIRDIYMNQHTVGWQLLQEVLRIDLDNSHVMHTTVSKAVDDYIHYICLYIYNNIITIVLYIFLLLLVLLYNDFTYYHYSTYIFLTSYYVCIY